MRKLTGFVKSAAGITLVTFTAATFAIATGAASAAPSDMSGGTKVPMKETMRRCDWSQILTVPPTPRQGYATADAVIHGAGSGTVVAEVHMVNIPAPDTHYDVGLIQVPRPTSATCGPGDPGTTYGSLTTDSGGRGETTLQSGIGPGTTGVWVVIQTPNPHSQNPAEYYTSDFVAPV